MDVEAKMRIRIVALAALVLVLTAAPAFADDLTVDVTMGTRGAVPIDASFDVTVTASSPRLWQGWVVLEASSLRFAVPLELPAGTAKETAIRVPPLPAGTTLRVFLESTDGTRGAIQRFGQDADTGVTWVAAHRVSAADLDAISRARTVPAGTAPRVEEVPDLADLSGFGYLVVGEALSPADVDTVTAWVEQGGRLVGPATVVAAVGAGADTEVAGLAVTLLGAGEVIATDGGQVDWDTVLRDTGVRRSGEPGGVTDPYSSLLASAVGVGGSPLGTMPGLLPGLALYVVVAGPVNLLILGRLRKRHLAWVTIPVISMVAVGVLWLLGPRQHRVDVTAAQIVVGASDHHTVWSAMAAGDGDYLIDPDADLVAGLGPRRANAVTGPDGSLTLDLATGEPAGVYTWRSGESPLEAVMEDGRWRVTNVSDSTVTLWGVAERDRLFYASNPLAPGETGTPAQVLDVGDPWTPRLQQVIWNTAFSDNRAWTVYEPLMGATQAFTAGIDTFAWGLVEEDRIPLAVDGQDRMVETVRMLVHPLDAGFPAAGGSAAMVANDGLFSDGANGVYYGSGNLILAFRVDPAATSLLVEVDDWGIPIGDELEIFDFGTGEFEPVVGLEVADAVGNVAGSGDVYLRVTVRETEVWPAMIRLEVRP